MSSSSALESAQAGYESVCAYALDFFDVYLKNQKGRREKLVTTFRDTKFGGASRMSSIYRWVRRGRHPTQTNSTSHRHCGRFDLS